ncbi:MAG: DoxX family protein [Candidatus Binatia bacterium]|nr:DoxX family protein [Candidatus Binatia bacterium]
MEILFQGAKILSLTLFLGYGLSCLFTGAMEAEFARFGLSRWRRLTGALEVLGGFGILLGHFFSPLLIASAAGLSLLMFLGVLTRIRVRDPLLETLPALLLMFVNLFIVLHAAGADLQIADLKPFWGSTLT